MRVVPLWCVRHGGRGVVVAAASLGGLYVCMTTAACICQCVIPSLFRAPQPTSDAYIDHQQLSGDIPEEDPRVAAIGQSCGVAMSEHCSPHALRSITNRPHAADPPTTVSSTTVCDISHSRPDLCGPPDDDRACFTKLGRYCFRRRYHTSLVEIHPKRAFGAKPSLQPSREPLPYATHTAQATPRHAPRPRPPPALRRPCMYSSHAVPCSVGGVMVGNGQSGERHGRCHSVKLPYGANSLQAPMAQRFPGRQCPRFVVFALAADSGVVRFVIRTGIFGKIRSRFYHE